MTDAPQSEGETIETQRPLPQSVLRPQRRVSAAWLVPAAALLLAGWLAYHAWSGVDAIGNATSFVLLGGGSATATLLLARRAGPALKSGDESRSLGEG